MELRVSPARHGSEGTGAAASGPACGDTRQTVVSVASTCGAAGARMWAPARGARDRKRKLSTLRYKGDCLKCLCKKCYQNE
jgi:hypothetical protein